MWKRLFGAGLILWSAVAEAGDVSKVTLRDHEFKVLKVLEDQTSLDSFSKAWQGKSVHKGGEAPKWAYKLDVEQQGQSVRYQYDPRGFVQVLSKAVVPVYQVPTPEAFNTLIGAHYVAPQQDASQTPRQ